MFVREVIRMYVAYQTIAAINQQLIQAAVASAASQTCSVSFRVLIRHFTAKQKTNQLHIFF